MEFKMSEIHFLKKKQTIFFLFCYTIDFDIQFKLHLIKKFFIAHLIIYNSDEAKLQ